MSNLIDKVDLLLSKVRDKVVEIIEEEGDLLEGIDPVELTVVALQLVDVEEVPVSSLVGIVDRTQVQFIIDDEFGFDIGDQEYESED